MDDLPYKKYLFLAIPYSGALSFFYLYGYWGFFRINVLEFISLSDLAKLALFPFIASFVSLAITILPSQLLGWNLFTPGAGAGTYIAKTGRKYWLYLVLLNFVLILLVFHIMPEPKKWFYIALLISLYSVFLTYSRFMVELISNPSVRGFISWCPVLALGLAFHAGNKEAYLIKTGHGHNLIDIERSKLPLKYDEKNPVAYLGHISEYFALYESATDNIVLVKTKEDVPLFIKPSPKDKKKK